MKYTAPQNRNISNDETNKLPFHASDAQEIDVSRAETQASQSPHKTQKVASFEDEALAIIQSMEKGLPKGNVELASILGHAPSQTALKKPLGQGMSKQELIQFLLTDPNLKIEIGVGR